MIYTTHYKSPIGDILLASQNNKLIGLWIEGQKYYFSCLKDEIKEEEKEILIKTKEWLDRYFKGEEPSINELDLNPLGSDFRKGVWKILCEIPYGEVITYKDIADTIAKQKGLKKMSSQAVGGAVSHNPISIIIPCHRVVGSNGSLTGYASGIDKKIYLLKHEKVNMEKLFIPKKGTAYSIMIKRCKWCNLDNPIYIKYHDEEWGIPNFNDKYLFEMLILESFQAGLSWECVLNKRENFRHAYDNFDIDKIVCYNETKINELKENKGIIRNKLKIKASINNAKIFKKIEKEYGSFSKYIWGFTNNKIIYEIGKTSSELSDQISKDLKKKGMNFVGTTIIYAYLQAIGIVNSHDEKCFKYKKGNQNG